MTVVERTGWNLTIVRSEVSYARGTLWSFNHHTWLLTTPGVLKRGYIAQSPQLLWVFTGLWRLADATCEEETLLWDGLSACGDGTLPTRVLSEEEWK